MARQYMKVTVKSKQLRMPKLAMNKVSVANNARRVSNGKRKA